MGCFEIVLMLELVNIPLWFLFWMPAFVRIMGYRDSDFPGRHDKFLWFVVFLLTAPIAIVGPILFSAWRNQESAFEEQESTDEPG